MSRIGKLPVVIPSGVKLSLDGYTVHVEGPKGKLSQTFDNSVKMTLEGEHFSVQPASNSRYSGAMHGTVRSIVNSMVKGVTEGFKVVLEIQGVGFKAEVKGKQLVLALGYAHPCILDIPEGIKITVGETQDRNPLVTVEGASKQMVGQVAINIKRFYPVEPYKAKGVRIVGEHIRRKEGKKTA